MLGRHHEITCGCEWDYEIHYEVYFIFFRGAVGVIFFMDDNATCHRTLARSNSEGIIVRFLKMYRQVAGRNYPPTNKNTLIRALTEEWDKLPQQLLDNIVLVVKCCITLHVDISRTDLRCLEFQ
ncbi:hypothetical protein TNCV_527671 [Trichonephila clavipes]|nr:hypothetical protein TNCV_527671 [Trichonephila clavipes]